MKSKKSAKGKTILDPMIGQMDFEDWERSQPCHRCSHDKCSSPCKLYDRWLAKNPVKPLPNPEVCPTCGRSLHNSAMPAGGSVLTNSVLSPFAKLARSIPENWPDDCVLCWDQEMNHVILNYFAKGKVVGGITIRQWRALANVGTEQGKGG